MTLCLVEYESGIFVADENLEKQKYLAWKIDEFLNFGKSNHFVHPRNGVQRNH